MPNTQLLKLQINNAAVHTKTKLAKLHVMTALMISLHSGTVAHAWISVQLARSSLMIKVVKFVECEFRCVSFSAMFKLVFNTFHLPNNKKHAQHTTLVTPNK